MQDISNQEEYDYKKIKMHHKKNTKSQNRNVYEILQRNALKIWQNACREGQPQMNLLWNEQTTKPKSNVNSDKMKMKIKSIACKILKNCIMRNDSALTTIYCTVAAQI